MIQQIIKNTRKVRSEGFENNDNEREKSPQRKSHGDKPDRPFYKITSSHASRIPAFSLTQHVTEFVVTNAGFAPEAGLKSMFIDMIESAYRADVEEGRGLPDKFSMIIKGEGLDKPLSIPLRDRQQNNADAIMGIIWKLAQSDKLINFLNSELQCILTTARVPNGGGITLKQFKQLPYAYKEKQRIKINNTNNVYCLFYALEAARKYHDDYIISEYKDDKLNMPCGLLTRNSWDRYMRNEKRQREGALELMETIGFNMERDAYGIECLDRVQEFYDTKYPNMYRIVAFDDSRTLKPIFKGVEKRKYDVALFLENNHWSGLRNIAAFFDVKYYCVDCEISYDADWKHRKECVSHCSKCGRKGFEYPCKDEGLRKICPNCKKTFYGEDCFEHHEYIMCKKFNRCLKCGFDYAVEKDKRGKIIKHECDLKRCGRCHRIHKGKHCFMKPLRPLKPKPDYRIMVYDFECRQDVEERNGIYVHVPNALSVRWACTNCLGNYKKGCKICTLMGGNKECKLYWSEPEGHTPAYDFINWMLMAVQYSKVPTYIWGHYAAKYDSHLILDQLYLRKLVPNVLMCGTKIYEIAIKQTSKSQPIILRDSFLLLNNKLANLPKTFGLNCEDKGHYPHYYNTKQNYGTTLPHLPPLECYGPDGKKTSEREELIRWHRENYNTPFEFEAELKKYNEQDTQILFEAILKTREIVLEIVPGFDSLIYGCTTAGLAMAIMKNQFVENNTIPIIPEKGFELEDNNSLIAIRHMEWLKKVNGWAIIQHAGNGPEKRLKIGDNEYKLDGYVPVQANNEEEFAIEVFGCMIHGCLNCMDREKKCVSGKTAEYEYSKTMERLEKIRGVMRVDTYWTCEIKKQMKENPEMKKYMDEIPDKGPINPRDAYFGGRTGNCRFFAEADEEKEILMADIVSLYPYVMFSEKFPVGIPEIMVPTETHVNWTSPSDVKFDEKEIRGLIKCRVTAPKHLLHPVIPARVGEFLMFANCLKCAEKLQADPSVQPICRHKDEERAFYPTITHLELHEALRQGYKVDRFYRAWHWDEDLWRDDLFKPYIKMFLKIKVESSGWPKEAENDPIKQREFLEQYREMGIDLDPAKMKFNPGMRAIAKLALNSLWGKFSMRNNLSTSEVVKSPHRFYQLVQDHTKEICIPHVINGDTVRVVIKSREEYIEPHSCSNIVISLWCTSAARMVLYRYMQESEANGWNVMYTDTDSIIAIGPRGTQPFKFGDQLGEMSREHASKQILRFVSGGAKQYGLLFDKGQLLKIRGFTLDHKTSQKIDFEVMEQLVRSGEGIVFSYDQIRAGFNSKITTRKVQKKYQPKSMKGVKDGDMLRPFGYI
jgi:hypothetical protein